MTGNVVPSNVLTKTYALYLAYGNIGASEKLNVDKRTVYTRVMQVRKGLAPDQIKADKRTSMSAGRAYAVRARYAGVDCEQNVSRLANPRTGDNAHSRSLANDASHPENACSHAIVESAATLREYERLRRTLADMAASI